MLFSGGTPVSSFVWNRNVGGVSAVTCFSVDSSSTRAGSGPLAQQVALRSLVRVGGVEHDHGIAENREVRTRADALDRDPPPRGRPARTDVAAVEARWPPAEKPITPMRSGRTPYRQARERTDRIARKHIILLRRMVVLRTKPVLEDEGSDTLGVPPARDLLAFVIDREIPIRAAGTDDHGGSDRALRRWQVHRQSRRVLGSVALGPGRPAWPQLDNLRRRPAALGQSRRRREQESSDA